jgi:hypothetical protein
LVQDEENEEEEELILEVTKEQKWSWERRGSVSILSVDYVKD